MYLLEFRLEGLPKTVNAFKRAHWTVHHKHTKIWKRKVWAATWHLRPEAPLVCAKLTLTRRSAKEPDFDGLCSSFKCVIDGLRENSILVDDKMSNIGRPEYIWEYAPKSEGHIIVRVEELQKTGI